MVEGPRSSQVELDVSVMTISTEVHFLRRHRQRHGGDCCAEVESHLDSIQDEIDKLNRSGTGCCGEIRHRLDKMEQQLEQILRRLPDTIPASVTLTAN